VEPDDVAATMGRIRPHVRETPVLDLRAGELGLDQPVTLKLELLQRPEPGERVVVAVCGSNCDPATVVWPTTG
jgi:hypothetical protein